ncbi:HI1506-related protein [Providencia stuartii]|uniref:HI1506-related protein n=1 Tax=Providencia stuartii TaxID=588 RepID=UPI001FF1BA2D|nr:HI1506-related protein [Providencia stuartii]MCK1142218.1 HI1506-related protein [Providencia stuartii]
MPILITAKVNGFRRCGIAHSDTATQYPDDHFTKEQLATLQAEPMLVVSVGANAAKQQPDAGADKQIAALKAEVKRLGAEVERLTKDNAELHENVTKLTEDNADLVNELSALKSSAPGTESSAEPKADDKTAPKGK